MSIKSPDFVTQINDLSTFLSYEQIKTQNQLFELFASDTKNNDNTHVIVLCASAILAVAESVFSACEALSKQAGKQILPMYFNLAKSKILNRNNQ